MPLPPGGERQHGGKKKDKDAASSRGSRPDASARTGHHHLRIT